MTVHVLDTGAVYLLHDRGYGAAARRLRATLEGAEPGHAFTPEIVLAEAEQARALARGRLDDILALAAVPRQVAPRMVAEYAAQALRALKRGTCGECGGLLRPTLVDAWLVSFARLYALDGDDVVIHTSDVRDLEALRDQLGLDSTQVEIRSCS